MIVLVCNWLTDDWLTDWLTGWLTDWLTDWAWLTDWLLTDWLTIDWLTDWLTIDWLPDWLTIDYWLTPPELSCSPGISAMKTFSRSLTFPCSPNAGTMLLSVICTRSSIIYPLLLTLTTLSPGLRSVTWIPVLLFLLSVVWPCAKNTFILMLQHSGITSLSTSSNAILCSPSSQPSVPILASQFHCLFWCCFFFFCVFLLFS